LPATCRPLLRGTRAPCRATSGGTRIRVQAGRRCKKMRSRDGSPLWSRRGGFGAGGLWVEAYRAELVPGGPIFFTLVREPGNEAPRVAAVSREPVNIHHWRGAGLIEVGWREDAEAAVRGYFEALERRDFAGAVRWVHPEWRDFTAMPERELRSLRLLSTEFYGGQRVGRVVLLEYKVEAWARYPGFFTYLFTGQPYPRSSGRNIYFVMLAPLDPPVPATWRIVCIGSGP